MPKNIVQYDILISCPGDIISEISLIEDAVSQFNSQFSDTLGICVRTKHWRKNSYAQSGGKPQTLLNEQFVNDCDAAVAILWTRFGTPTDEYNSGTEEEVEIMLSSGKQVFMYFSDKPLSPSQINDESYKKVQTFRNKYKNRGIYFTYSSDEEFKQLFFAHLSQYFLSKKRVAEVKSERLSLLKVVGIDQNQHINNEVPIISFVPNTEMTTNKCFETICDLINNISAIKLEKHIEYSEALSRYISFNNEFVEISEDCQRIIHSFADTYNINIPDDFFALGNLSKISKPTDIFGESSLSGTSDEKRKYYNIIELLDNISKFLEWVPIESAFSRKKCLKLALQNYGTDIDEDIEISLRIPKNSLLTTCEFPKLKNDEMGYLLNDCDMSEFFGICNTSTYLDYKSSIVTSRRFTPPVSSSFIFPGYTRDYSDSFERELADVFCYSCFDEGEEYIVKLKFDYIKHNTTIAFPSVIFVKEPFTEISYTITSKNLPKMVSGNIKIANDTLNK